MFWAEAFIRGPLLGVKQPKPQAPAPVVVVAKTAVERIKIPRLKVPKKVRLQLPAKVCTCCLRKRVGRAFIHMPYDVCQKCVAKIAVEKVREQKRMAGAK
jgi:hypothetical protein